MNIHYVCRNRPTDRPATGVCKDGDAWKTELGLSNLAVNSQEGSRVLPVTLALWAHRHEACSRKVGKSARRLEKPPGEKE